MSDTDETEPTISISEQLLIVTFTDGTRTFRAAANVPTGRHFETGESIAYDQNQTVEVTPAMMDELLGTMKPKPLGFSVGGRVHPTVDAPSGATLRESAEAIRNRVARNSDALALRSQQTETFCPEPECADVEVTDGARTMTLRIRLGRYDHPVGGWWVLRAPDAGRKFLAPAEYDCLLDELAGKKALDHLGAQMAQHVRIVSSNTKM